MELDQDSVPLPDLDIIVETLIEAMSGDDIQTVHMMTRERCYMLHHTVGQHLRNQWSLWEKDTPIGRYFAENFGTCHADDISSIIIDAVWAKVNHKERITPEHHREKFREYWLNKGYDAKTMKKL